MNRFKFWLFKKIQPFYLKLEQAVKIEIYRAARLAAIAEGERLWKKFRTGLPPAGSTEDALLQYHRRSDRDLSGCRHTKGGRLNVAKDFAVYGHTFPDGSLRIKCTICPKTWYPSDADWKDAVKMTENSTNTWSSSEVVLQNSESKLPAESHTVVFFDKGK